MAENRGKRIIPAVLLSSVKTDNDYPIDRFSGSEQDDIAVALRIALSRYPAGLRPVHESIFLIFDEIFGSHDRRIQ